MTTPDSIRDALLSSPKVRPVGGRTKHALSGLSDGVAALDLSGYRGITEYDPGEFTFTARAGTPLSEIAEALAKNGQYLPFDPPLVQAGATLGGAIASGLNGPGRLRYGGARDFILGAVFLTGDGRLVHGGGKVVKNAAGFDFPKLLVGSCGRLGVILEATFKVFPTPQATLTAAADAGSLESALALAGRLGRLPADLDALEILPTGRVFIRLAGDAGTLEARLERLGREAQGRFQPAPDGLPADVTAPRGVKIPVTPARILALDAALAQLGLTERHYGVAGHAAHVRADADALPKLNQTLRDFGLAGLSIFHAPARLGAWTTHEAEALVAQALNPSQRLG